MTLLSKDIEKTSSEVKDGVQYITHYVNRSRQDGDPLGSEEGVMGIGNRITTIITNYVYK